MEGYMGGKLRTGTATERELAELTKRVEAIEQSHIPDQAAVPSNYTINEKGEVEPIEQELPLSELGDLLSIDGGGTLGALPRGNDGDTLFSDETEPLGLRWGSNEPPEPEYDLVTVTLAEGEQEKTIPFVPTSTVRAIVALTAVFYRGGAFGLTEITYGGTGIGSVGSGGSGGVFSWTTNFQNALPVGPQNFVIKKPGVTKYSLACRIFVLYASHGLDRSGLGSGSGETVNVGTVSNPGASFPVVVFSVLAGEAASVPVDRNFPLVGNGTFTREANVDSYEFTAGFADAGIFAPSWVQSEAKLAKLATIGVGFLEP